MWVPSLFSLVALGFFIFCFHQFYYALPTCGFLYIYPTWVFLGALSYCALMSVFSLGKFQAIISFHFPPCLFFLFSSGTSVTWIIDHFTMSHMSFMRSSSLTNLSSISPVLFSAMANLWLNTCSVWSFYCLILNFSFDNILAFPGICSVFHFIFYLKKTQNQTLSVKSIVYVSHESDPLCQVLVFGVSWRGVGVWSNGMFHNFWWNAGYWNMKYFRDNLKLWIFFPPEKFAFGVWLG